MVGPVSVSKVNSLFDFQGDSGQRCVVWSGSAEVALDQLQSRSSNRSERSFGMAVDPPGKPCRWTSFDAGERQMGTKCPRLGWKTECSTASFTFRGYPGQPIRVREADPDDIRSAGRWERPDTSEVQRSIRWGCNGRTNVVHEVRDAGRRGRAKKLHSDVQIIGSDGADGAPEPSQICDQVGDCGETWDSHGPEASQRFTHEETSGRRSRSD